LFLALRTAVIATALATAFCGVAQAKSPVSRIEPADVVIAALAADSSATLSAKETFVLDEQSGTQLRTTTFVVPPAVRSKLAALEAAGNMPAPNADLVMWGGGDSAVSNSKHTEQITRFARGIISRTSSIAMSLTRSAMRFIGTPYVFGGTSPSGFDCSGYVQHVFAMLGISLPRTADAQYYAGKPTIGGMQMGDLVFFQTYEPGPSHVGIYLGGGKFISSSGHGVMVSSLSDSYWAARYIGAKRVVAAR
jgi:cell wall-associated NlpC family hydrolase